MVACVGGLGGARGANNDRERYCSDGEGHAHVWEGTMGKFEDKPLPCRPGRDMGQTRECRGVLRRFYIPKSQNDVEGRA